MRIGFDAKRAFWNNSGLGNYSRGIITQLNRYYPENEYFLFASGSNSGLFQTPPGNTLIGPDHLVYRALPALWRSYGIGSALKSMNLDIYHGLSNEIPFSLKNVNTRIIVTIHDLIFLKYPELYPFIDRTTYLFKFKFACEHADLIIAVSEATRQDIIHYFGIHQDKIQVGYQGYKEIYHQKATESQKTSLRKKYGLPDQFILSVGTIESRKNTLSILKALHQAGIDFPIVIAGRETPYTDELRSFAKQNRLEHLLYIRSGISTEELPALYQSAILFIYPSFYEGFGIPILEAMASGIPVITSKGSCFSETGGEAALYFDPAQPAELAALLQMLLSNEALQTEMKRKGVEQAAKFNSNRIAERMMELYAGSKP